MREKRTDDLPARVRGKVEDENGEERDGYTRQDQIDRVEQRLPTKMDVVLKHALRSISFTG